MTKAGRRAFDKLWNLGAPVVEPVWSGIEFKLDLVEGREDRLRGDSEEHWAISPASRARKSRRLRNSGWTYGLNPKLNSILRKHHLTASWQSESIINVNVNKGAI